MSISSKKERKNIKRLLRLVVNRDLDDPYFFETKEKFMSRKNTSIKIIDTELATIRPSKKVTIQPKNEKKSEPDNFW